MKKHLETHGWHLPAAEGKIVTRGVASTSSGALNWQVRIPVKMASTQA